VTSQDRPPQYSRDASLKHWTTDCNRHWQLTIDCYRW